MFEKEAEEYLKKLLKRLKIKEEDLVENQPKFISWEKMNFISLNVSNVSKAFQDGAEFGYNKANEWHYVKDGDLPKETGLLMSKTLLLVIKMKGSDCLSLALGQYNFSTQEFSYQHIVGLTDVIAWKEIVLPKESN